VRAQEAEIGPRSSSGTVIASDPEPSRLATVSNLRIPCPNCQGVLKVPRDFPNEAIVCRHCEHEFLYESREAASSRSGGPTLGRDEVDRVQARERERLRAQLLEKERRCIELSTRLDQLTEESERLHAGLKEREARLAEVVACRDEAGRQADKIRAQQLVDLLQRLADAEQKNERLSDEQCECERARRGAVEQVRTLLEEVEHVHDELRARDERLEQLASRLVESERDAEEQRTVRQKVEQALAEAVEHNRRFEQESVQIRAEHLDLNRRLDETIAQLVAERDEQSRTFDAARTRWEAERRDLFAQWDRDRQSIEAETERRLDEGRTRIEADQCTLLGQLGQERQSLTSRFDAARLEEEAAREDAERHARDLAQERDRLASRLDAQEKAARETEMGLREIVDSQRQALEQARNEVQAGADRAESLSRQIAALEDDLVRQRREREDAERIHQEQVDSLKKQLDASRADATLIDTAGPAGPRVALAATPGHRQSTMEHAGRAEARPRDTREPGVLLSHDAALARLFGESDGRPDAPDPAPLADALTTAQRRIEELRKRLQQTEQINQNLRGLLSSLGIQTK
jgi:chromosome segregation ATPase